ncbi:MAG TPA: DUF3152 domain-containing protein [Acidimicrobiia bacterium]|jgi:hypothetical protein
MLRRFSVALCLVTGIAVLPAGAAPAVEYRFTVATRGPVSSDVDAFAATVARVLGDAQGWALDGRVRFTRVESGGDFTVWLAAASAMRSFGPPCHPRYSCRSGRNVVINDDRWTAGSEPWTGPLEEYRTMVVNHETGHWLRFGHAACGDSGQPAPVMMQQSKRTGACAPNPWPLPSEREAFERRLRLASASQPTVALAGKWTVTADGRVSPDGLGDASSQSVVGMAATPSGAGYWLASRDGGVFAFGDAPFLGTPPSTQVVAVTGTPSGGGYWLAGADGAVFGFGDAPFLGRAPEALNQPVVGMAATPTGRGYWLVGADGGVFAFGDAPFLGRAPEALNRPVVGMAGTPTGQGYWLAAGDGGVFTFGDARFRGTGPSGTVAIAATPDGTYRLATVDGVVTTPGT